MSARPLRITEFSGAIIRSYTVKASSTATKGKAAKLDGSGAVLDIAAVSDNAIGIFLDTGAAGDVVRVALWGAGVVPVLVGTGGATEGAPLKYVSDGATTATIGGGTVKQIIVGQCLETGVAGDLVGCNLGCFGWSVSA